MSYKQNISDEIEACGKCKYINILYAKTMITGKDTNNCMLESKNIDEC